MGVEGNLPGIFTISAVVGVRAIGFEAGASPTTLLLILYKAVTPQVVGFVTVVMPTPVHKKRVHTKDRWEWKETCRVFS